MSLSPPRVLNNGTPRTYALYWCYQCHRTVRVASTNPSGIACPRCSGQFVYEIDVARPRLVVDFTDFDPSPDARLLEALSLVPDPPITRFNHCVYNPETESRAERRWRRRFLVRPSYPSSDQNELIEQMTQNDQPGPLPLHDSAINTIPTVKIMADHLTNDSQCPVCKEEFNVDGEARELPCKHIYHFECIVPWLHLHDSCTVCRRPVRRHELPPSCQEDARQNDSEPEDIHAGGGSRPRCWGGLRWSQLASLWPFRARNRPINLHGDDHVVTSRRSASWEEGSGHRSRLRICRECWMIS